MDDRKLIEIKKAKKVIFVGDTHGDLEASQKVITNYLLFFWEIMLIEGKNQKKTSIFY